MIRILIMLAIATVMVLAVLATASKLSKDEHKAKSKEITDGFRESIDEVAKKVKENN